MSDRRFTRAAIWLGTRLAVSDADGGEWVSALLREAAQLGFAEPIARAAFGEIGATAERYGTSSEIWSLSPAHRQIWANFAAANKIPAITNTPPEAMVEFWKPKRSATTSATSPTSAAPPKTVVYIGPPLSAVPALLKAATERALEARADAAARTSADATAPRIDAAKYRAARQEAVAKARGR